MEAVTREPRDIESWISILLRTGVLLSLLLLGVGTTLSFWHHPAYFWDQTQLKDLIGNSAAFPHSARDVARSVEAVRGRGLVTLGLGVLILTPILRVAASTLVFWRQKDRVFTTITAVVLGLLLLSLTLGKGIH
jgi:uncharacterized membrane protein